jgi:hypothetical protein
LRRLRRLERWCVRQDPASELAHFRELAEVLASLAVVMEMTRDPVVWLCAMATVSRRRAEALILRRLRTQCAP